MAHSYDPATGRLTIDGTAAVLVEWTVSWDNGVGAAISEGSLALQSETGGLTSLTLTAADFALVEGEIEADTGGLGVPTLRAAATVGAILDARATLPSMEAGSYRVETRYHDEADGPGALELHVNGVLSATRSMVFEPTGDPAPTAANLVTWTVLSMNLRPGDVLRLVCRPANGEPGRIRSVSLTRTGPVDAANPPDTPHAP